MYSFCFYLIPIIQHIFLFIIFRLFLIIPFVLFFFFFVQTSELTARKYGHLSNIRKGLTVMCWALGSNRLTHTHTLTVALSYTQWSPAERVRGRGPDPVRSLQQINFPPLFFFSDKKTVRKKKEVHENDTQSLSEGLNKSADFHTPQLSVVSTLYLFSYKDVFFSSCQFICTLIRNPTAESVVGRLSCNLLKM